MGFWLNPDESSFVPSMSVYRRLADKVMDIRIYGRQGTRMSIELIDKRLEVLACFSEGAFKDVWEIVYELVSPVQRAWMRRYDKGTNANG
jgi:hypothetical protein